MDCLYSPADFVLFNVSRQTKYLLHPKGDQISRSVTAAKRI